MAALRRGLRFAVFAALAIYPVSAYYHYTHYLNGGTVHERFDLAALPNKTVTYFVTDSGPSVYPLNDTFSSVLSQVRQAVATWNSVATSDIRLAFGGLYSSSTPLPATPGGQVEFVQLPPGIYGLGGPTVPATVNPNWTFVPIVRSNIYLTADLTQKPGPSYSEGFFLTTVHEMGHSLGLQHTFTSSAMSTVATRATSLTRPIDADDIAGLSVLYPAANFVVQTGSLAGRVTANGAGVHMASVVAIRNGYGAVSAISGPDGSYRIDGVPPGQYYVYAHPLPPGSTSSCTDVCPPADSSGNPVAPSGPFNTIFFGGTSNGTTNLLQATTVNVLAGQVTTGVNFAVTPRADVPVYGVSIFSYFGTNVVSPGYLNMGPQGYGNFLAGGPGLTAAGKVTAGLGLQIMGGGASVYAIVPYTDTNSYTYLNVGAQYSLGASTGPQHLIFSLGNFIYVLPSGLNLVSKAPPSVSGVATNPDGSVSISGTSFAPDSLFYFDGLPSAIRTLNDQAGQALVTPPPGAGGQNATVAVYNHDGQNSLFLQANSPVTYAYGAKAVPSFTMSPASLPAGSEALVTITGTNTQFTAGQTVVGFGSSDVYVRYVIVQGPGQLLADLSIPATAVNTTTEASVVSGFQIATLQNGFRVTAPVPNVPQVIPQLLNATVGQTGAYPGAIVDFTGLNLLNGATTPSVTINGTQANVISASNTSVTLQLPTSLPTGGAILALNNGTASSLPVAVNIDPLPAVITAIASGANTAFDGAHPASGGNVVNVSLSGFADPSAVVFPSQVTINVGGVNHSAVAVEAIGGGLFQVRFVLSNLVPTGARTPITVYLDGRSSYPASFITQNN